MKRCKRIELIRGYRLRGLEGCPDGFKSLYIEYASRISYLSPLTSCTRLKKLNLTYVGCTYDLNPLLSLPMMPLLEELDLSFGSIKDVFPLSQCKGLKELSVRGNEGIQDLSPSSSVLISMS